jgi:hypothetical protein
MPTTTSPFSGSILYRDQQSTLDLIEAAAKDWVDRAARHEQINEETASLLAQMVRICLRSPDMMGDLWEWAQTEDLAGRLPDRQRAGDDLRDLFGNWLQLLTLIQQAVRRAEPEGYPVKGANELDRIAAEMDSLLQLVNETWPAQAPSATPSLSYDQLRSLADRFPPPPQWYEEKDDLF